MTFAHMTEFYDFSVHIWKSIWAWQSAISSVGHDLAKSKGGTMSKFLPFYQQTDLYSTFTDRDLNLFIQSYVRDLTWPASFFV